jgi:hypothetical protein
MQCACTILLSVACSDLQYFSTLSHKRHDFPKKNFLAIKCLSIFSTNVCEMFLIQCRSQWPRGLRPPDCWDCGFESQRGHGCLPVVSVVCCQVEVSATSWSLVQRSPTDCGVSLWVIKKPRKRGGYSPLPGCENTRTMCCSVRKTTPTYLIQWDILINVVRSSGTVIVFLVGNLKIPYRFSTNPEISNFIKICRVGAELFHADGRTDRHDKSFFCNSVDAPKSAKFLIRPYLQTRPQEYLKYPK